MIIYAVIEEEPCEGRNIVGYYLKLDDAKTELEKVVKEYFEIFPYATSTEHFIEGIEVK